MRVRSKKSSPYVKFSSKFALTSHFNVNWFIEAQTNHVEGLYNAFGFSRGHFDTLPSCVWPKAVEAEHPGRALSIYWEKSSKISLELIMPLSLLLCLR